MRKITLFIALVLLLGCLAGCEGSTQPPSGGDTSSTAEDAGTTEPVAEQLRLIENGAARFTIAYPDYPGSDVLTAARKLAEAIYNATGVTIPCKKISDVAEAVPVILIGDTGRAESDAVLQSIKLTDYAIVQSGDSVVITAHTPELITRAISYYCKNLIERNISTADGGIDLLFEPYSFVTEPAISSFTIAGQEVKEMRIVYAAGEDGYKESATTLAENIAERYGYQLEVVSDTRAAEGCEILIGPTNRPQSEQLMKASPCATLEYAFGVVDGSLAIIGKPYSCLQAVTRFGSRYLYSGDKTIAIEEGMLLKDTLRTVDEAPLAEGADIRVMTANILAEMESWGGTTPVFRRAEIFAAVLDVYEPDVVGVQEVTDAWYRYLPQYVGEKYAFLHQKTPTGLTNYSSILYDKTKYDVIDSGVQYFTTEGANNIRLVTWAVFSSKDGSLKFSLFNTHWCWDTAEHARKQAEEEAALIKKVTEKYPYPYFCTADYNTKQETENYYHFIELTGAVDAKYAARDAGTLLNISGGCGNLGTPRGESGNSIDHIFMTATCEARAFATVTANQTYDISDHSPKYVDAKLK